MNGRAVPVPVPVPVSLPVSVSVTGGAVPAWSPPGCSYTRMRHRRGSVIAVARECPSRALLGPDGREEPGREYSPTTTGTARPFMAISSDPQINAVDSNRAEAVLDLFDDVRAMTWRLLHPKTS